jgi:hypothetical protein
MSNELNLDELERMMKGAGDDRLGAFGLTADALYDHALRNAAPALITAAREQAAMKTTVEYRVSCGNGVDGRHCSREARWDNLEAVVAIQRYQAHNNNEVVIQTRTVALGEWTDLRR